MAASGDLSFCRPSLPSPTSGHASPSSPQSHGATASQEAKTGISPTSWSSQGFTGQRTISLTSHAVCMGLDQPSWEFGGHSLGAGCISTANFCHLKAMIQKPDSHRCFPKPWALLQPAGTGPDREGHVQVSFPAMTMGQIFKINKAQ